MQRSVQLLAGAEVMALKHVLDAPIEPLDHAVGLRRSWRRQAVFNVQFSAELIELMLPRCYPLSQTKQPVGELFSVVCENGADADGTGTFKIPQEAAGVGRRLIVVDADKDPAGGPPFRRCSASPAGQ